MDLIPKFLEWTILGGSVIGNVYLFFLNRRKNRIELIKQYEKLADEMGKTVVDLRSKILEYEQSKIKETILVKELKRIAEEFEKHKQTCEYYKNKSNK